MSDREELISQFSNVTGVSSERAKFFLESAAWQIEVALASFYENDGNDEDLELLEDSLAERRRVPPPDGSPDLGPARTAIKKPAKPTKKENPPKRASSSSSRITTLAGLSKERDSSSDEDEGQAFYAGGSEHSGQQVLGPGKKKRDFVSEMFKSVQEHGAEVVEPTASGSGRSKSSTFSGTGYKLGMSPSDETVAIPDRRDTPRHTEVVLKLWKTGFSINDGALREYTDSNNKEFLDSIRKGEVPQELVHDARGSEVHLNMEDHRHEQYTAPKSRPKAFSGKGNMLGSPSPHTTASATAIGAASISSVASTIIASASNTENEARARELVPLDQAQPTTTVQIRLADGTRLQAQFNHQHTVADLRTYLEQARPAYHRQNYGLLTTFPSRELTEPSQTFEQAGLLNTAILQRLK